MKSATMDRIFSILVMFMLWGLCFGASNVPNPLPSVCYSGGVKTNPCRGNACAPCYLQLPDGTWGCFDLLPSGQCQWGENVSDRANKGESSSDDSPASSAGGDSKDASPTKVNGPTQATNNHKYSSTTYVISTVTLSGAPFINLTPLNYLYPLIATSILLWP